MNHPTLAALTPRQQEIEQRLVAGASFLLVRHAMCATQSEIDEVLRLHPHTMKERANRERLSARAARLSEGSWQRRRKSGAA